MKENKIGTLKTLLVFFIGVATLLVIGVLWPFWILFDKVVNLIGVRGIRSRNGKLQTPIVFYEHPVTKRVIVFVATIHIGEPAYYADIQQCIESLQGYKILFEGVGKLSLQEEQILTETEQDVLGQFNVVFRFTRKLAEIMSLQFQKDGFMYHSSWINTDMKFYDLIRLFAQRNICLIKTDHDIDELFSNQLTQDFSRWLVNVFFSRPVSTIIISTGVAFFSKNKRALQGLILDTRNEVAFQHISKHLDDDANIVTIWGAAHLSGIEKKLKHAGFREIDRAWFTAYTVRDYSFFDIFYREQHNRRCQ
ncbi:MAG: hypothetical protein RIQ54_405 [Candidatus Parcubacteria bacterium]|jgi:hypothetical protein